MHRPCIWIWAWSRSVRRWAIGLSALLIWRFPLDEARHDEIAQALILKNQEARRGLTGSWTGRSAPIPFPCSPSELLPEIVK
jgi:hypothetical protein